MRHPTPYPELNQVLDELRREVEAVLGHTLVGLYLQGSFALGDFDRHSDVDFIAVTQHELSETEARALEAMHDRIYRWEGGEHRQAPKLAGYTTPAEWAQHLEGSYFSLSELAAPPGTPVWYLDHGSTHLERSSHCNTLVVRWTLHWHGVALHGPDIRELLGPVDPHALRDESRQTLLDWGADILARPEPYANRFYQGLIVFTCCRVLHTVETGYVHSKRASARWALERLPQTWHGLLERAWATRPDPATSVQAEADPTDFAATLALVKWCLNRLTRAEDAPTL
ncbi:MAG TPA: aminoglycoside adenylyltransferase domain-containing protein [Fimbriimonadaceae bacterium]|nr:aminoglycoside adenylyltransferase domain-containing protein [Fimbriimonadaceae bacterium]